MRFDIFEIKTNHLMKNALFFLLGSLIFIFTSCSDDDLAQKGFSVTPSSRTSNKDNPIDGLKEDSLKFQTKPSSILLTKFPQYRLATLYMINYRKDRKSTFIGSNHFHGTYSDYSRRDGNQWNYNFMPGLEAVYGYNLVNVSHFDTASQKSHNLFETPVLIKTLYYPANTNDTLNNVPVVRNYYMVTAYNEDTNGDGFINVHDLRRLFYFNIEGQQKTLLIPENYAVVKSEYDPANDHMYIFAQLDENSNGKADDLEPTHVFWIDLKNPLNNGRVY